MGCAWVCCAVVATLYEPLALRGGYPLSRSTKAGAGALSNKRPRGGIAMCARLVQFGPARHAMSKASWFQQHIPGLVKGGLPHHVRSA